jgi:hypothetical protein
MGKSAATILTHTGWARSVAGIGPYLTLFSRAGLTRESVDAYVTTAENPRVAGGSRLTVCPAGNGFCAGAQNWGSHSANQK